MKNCCLCFCEALRIGGWTRQVSGAVMGAMVIVNRLQFLGLGRYNALLFRVESIC